MLPPATINSEIPIQSHVNLDLLHVDAWIELQMTQHNKTGVCVGGAEMVYCHE